MNQNVFLGKIWSQHPLSLGAKIMHLRSRVPGEDGGFGGNIKAKNPGGGGWLKAFFGLKT